MVPLNTLGVGDQGQIVKIEKEYCNDQEEGLSPHSCECQGTENKIINSSHHGRGHGRKPHLKNNSNSHNSQFHCRIEEMGLRIGKNVSILQKGKRGPILVKVDETRIALGQGMAAKILIQNS
jgi:ferrous iron transport protein A